MSREELIRAIHEAFVVGGPEEGHMEADRLLLEYIGDDDVSAAFLAHDKWYA